MRSTRPRSERGSALFEMPLLVGLIMIPFGLLVITVPTWVERQTAARDAAGEVARSIVVGDVDQASILASIERGYELPSGTLRVASGSSYLAGDSVVVVVEVAMPAVDLPLFGSFGHLSWSTEHVERYPDFGEDR
ncbi:MAG: hypothetical protein R2706_16395 [Acidimicrobiales bacterium]